MNTAGKATIEISYQVSSGKPRMVWASFGQVRGEGSSKTEAKADLLAKLAHLAANPEPFVWRKNNETIVIGHASPHCADDFILSPSRAGSARATSGSTIVGSQGRTLEELTKEYANAIG